MIYNELKQIAQPHIREGENLPSNALLLLNQLHIQYKTEGQAREDFEGKYNPLDNHPAFLFVDEYKNKTVYFNTATKYWNFYIFHEIAHYLLDHEDDSPQNEIDADMLACILAAPVENLPTYLKTARDLSSLCQIPIDKAEMYWQEIKDKFSKWYKKIWIASITTIIILIIAYACSIFNTSENVSNGNITNPAFNKDTETVPNYEIVYDSDVYYKTSSGSHFHKPNCQHVKHKTNIISVTAKEVKALNLKPCEECIE